ncbi:MAG: hypothetical protein M1497_13785 [Nitrospirae bacterium]|nr:hypothetical protein [Nitrospirota bacterium]
MHPESAIKERLILRGDGRHPEFSVDSARAWHTSGFSGACCITLLVMRAGALGGPKLRRTGNEQGCSPDAYVFDDGIPGMPIIIP